MSTNPLVSIIVLNWNGQDVLLECLKSLQKTLYNPFEIIVVDNDSTDNSLALIDNFKTNVVLIRNRINLGYAKANNIGFLAAKGKYVVTLNNDIIVNSQWLSHAIPFLENNPQVGGVSCRQMNYYEREKVDILYSTVHRGLVFVPFGTGQPFVDQGPGYVISANGASAIYRRAMIEELKGFDESYQAFHEETDLCFRGLLKGWKFVFLPQCLVYHHRSFSFKKTPRFFQYLVERNRHRFILKNYPFKYIIWHLPILLAVELKTFLYHLMRLTLLGSYFRARVDNLLFFFSFQWWSSERNYQFKKHYSYFRALKKQKIIPIKMDLTFPIAQHKNEGFEA